MKIIMSFPSADSDCWICFRPAVVPVCWCGCDQALGNACWACLKQWVRDHPSYQVCGEAYLPCLPYGPSEPGSDSDDEPEGGAILQVSDEEMVAWLMSIGVALCEVGERWVRLDGPPEPEGELPRLRLVLHPHQMDDCCVD